MPGVGPLADISLLLPATFGLDATRAIVLLTQGEEFGRFFAVDAKRLAEGVRKAGKIEEKKP